MTKLADQCTVDLACVVWRKSSYTAGNGNCVEVAHIPGTTGIAVRDSKNTELPAARLTRSAWSTFVTAVAEGAVTLDG